MYISHFELLSHQFTVQKFVFWEEMPENYIILNNGFNFKRASCIRAA